MSVLEPLIQQLARCINKTSAQRILDNVFDPLLEACTTSPPEETSTEEPPAKRRKPDNGAVEDDTPSFPHVVGDNGPALRDAVLKRIFDVAAQPDTDPVNRRRMYAYAAKQGYASAA